MGWRWSTEDERYLIEAVRAGESKLAIAGVLGRSYDAVLSRIKVIAKREREVVSAKENESDRQVVGGG